MFAALVALDGVSAVSNSSGLDAVLESNRSSTIESQRVVDQT